MRKTIWPPLLFGILFGTICPLLILYGAKAAALPTTFNLTMATLAFIGLAAVVLLASRFRRNA